VLLGSVAIGKNWYPHALFYLSPSDNLCVHTKVEIGEWIHRFMITSSTIFI